MVVAALLDVQLAILLTSILALLVGLVSGNPELTLVYFAGGCVGALILWKAERTTAFAFAGLGVIIAQFTVGVCYYLVINSLDGATVGLMLVFNLASGLVSASLAFFSYSILGKLFGVTTVIQLLELAHPNQPLLRRLMREAPGTYHHSMLVGTLAEQAAERLAGDALLARVGAYYHDIGKLERPLYFIDNQGNGPNIHDTLDPRQSAKIIRSHVEDGVRLAEQHRLPKRVIDIIHQHHGTCLVSYFYNKAVNMGLDVNELDFRYAGPKPQTKIAALVMLADGSEAAVRANVQSGRIITGQTPAVQTLTTEQANRKMVTISEVVNKIVNDRIKDNQLDECDLTLRDIEQVRRLFIEILTSIYHPRVDYPDPATPKPSEGQVVSATTVVDVTPMDLARVTTSAADGGTPEAHPVLPAKTATTEKENQDTTTNPKPRPTGGIGGAGRLIGKERGIDE
jgi:putative nucleotidyltransferase with HDIG domain